ncbi:unnamed protein product [Symbiodinium sp. CCMP2592]|nr:unnamed protein product [Symbiodinium sp. CCMP2592]
MDAQESCSGVQYALKKAAREADNLQNELASANYHSTRQRRFMAEEETEASWQYENTCEAKDSNSESRQCVDALEEERRRLVLRLQELEDAEREGDDLEVKLGQARDEGAFLKTALGDLYQLVADRNAVLETVCSEHSALRSTLEESQQQARLAQDEANELARERDETHSRCRQEHEELQNAEVRMRDAEGAMEREHQDTESKVVEASRHRDTAHELVTKLNDNITANLQQRLKGLEDENKHLQGKISFLEGDCDKISAENTEMEQTIEEVKKKPNCVIS